jgi:stage V sporulation protein D (sporulation-specific penicillin-binding protein)
VAAVARANPAARRRAAVLSLWAVLALAALAGRLWDVQVLHGAALAAAGRHQRWVSLTLPAPRGGIVDRNGKALALSVPAARIVADPSLVPPQDAPRVAAELGQVLSVPTAEILHRLQGGGHYALLQDGATAEQGAAVQRLRLPGIYVLPSSRRVYPNLFFLGSVLGFVTSAGGAAGVELSYNRELAGTNGYEQVEVDALQGQPIPGTPAVTVPPKPGLTLQLTIDSGLQQDLEGQIEAAIAATGASRAYGIVMQPSTGAILAAAAWPTFDPGAYGDADPATWNNTVQGFDLVPGSVFKVITAAAVLQEGLAAPSTPFTDPGWLAVGGVRIHDFQTLTRDTTFQRAFEESSNVVFGTLGLRLGAPRFYQYLRAFGLLETPGSDLPGEQPNVVVPERRVRPVDLAEEAFGETLAVTPLALITAVNVVASGGVLVRPHVGQALLDPAGHVVRTVPVDRERQVLSPQVVQTLRQMMVGVVRYGTGERGFVPCYDVAGKTGTANIYGPGGVTDHYVASFVAFAPAEDPAVIALVMLYDPKGQEHEGGQVAAPVVQAVLSSALHRLGVPPACTPDNAAPPQPGQPGTTPQTLDMVTMPALGGLTPQDAQAAARAAGLQLQVEGSGPRILRQNPPAGAMVQRWTTVQAYTDPAALQPQGFVPVPDVVGQSPAQAAASLAASGLAMEAWGAGVAVGQDPPAGTRVAPGTAVQVTFAPAGRRGAGAS